MSGKFGFRYFKFAVEERMFAVLDPIDAAKDFIFAASSLKIGAQNPKF
ncbi:hypothetical protein [Kaistella pullorum]|uniref:Uncharacterized protein n=1 Tax=Kaistella pullorum TaxID=2763074 RepID=A0ABR8WJ86_9FLAO|nr:hypothetical protein [Kaistella pullorum]MBD8017129.1 hypothetical protein [Kaistella pullorum]